MARRNSRSHEARAYRRLYKTARWERIRQAKLGQNPLCERCETRGDIVPATVVHHVERHGGCAVTFYEGPFQALCAPCHDGEAQQEERLGYSSRIGADGWPVDEAHPANR